MAKTFGENLKFYRNTTQDPQRGKPLTQARFAELLAQRLGTEAIESNRE